AAAACHRPRLLRRPHADGDRRAARAAARHRQDADAPRDGPSACVRGRQRMSAEHEPFAELAAGYAVGALDPAAAAAFERHVAAGCPECEAALREYRAALVDAADALSTAPPPAVRDAVLRRIGPGRAPRRVGLLVGWATSVALAAGIAAVVSAGWVSRGYE